MYKYMNNLNRENIMYFILISLLIYIIIFNNKFFENNIKKDNSKKLNKLYLFKDRTLSVVFLLFDKNEGYYIKIKAFENKNINKLDKYYNNFFNEYFDKKTNKENIIKKLSNDAILLDNYVYEGRVYKIINKALMKSKEKNNIVEMVDNGFFDIKNKKFLIKIKNNTFDLYNNTFDLYNNKKKNLYKNISIGKFLNKKYSKTYYLVYTITKYYPGYDTFYNLINLHKLNKLNIELCIINTIKVLQKLKKLINFSHNDLHENNLLVNIDNKNIKLFDFDASGCFKLNILESNYVNILKKLYKNNSFINFIKKNNSISKYPPVNYKELEYTYDLFCLIIQPNLNVFILNLENNINNNYDEIFPKIIIETNNNIKILLVKKIITIINKELFNILKIYDCLADELKNLYFFKSNINYDTECMKNIISWLLFGNIKSLHFLLNNIKINI